MSTAAEAGECELGELSSTYKFIDFATGDKTISKNKVWEDAVSRQSTEKDL